MANFLSSLFSGNEKKGVNPKEQSKTTAKELTSIVNSKPEANHLGPDASPNELLQAIFDIMVKKEDFKLKQDELDDDKNDQRHLQLEKRHNTLLEALGVKPHTIPKKEEPALKDTNDIKKYLKKKKIKAKMPKTKKGFDFGLGSIAKLGKWVAGLSLVGVGLMMGKDSLASVISKGESGGDYTAYNKIDSSGKVTSGKGASIDGRSLTSMKVGEVMQLQSQRRVFAAGKYQVTPKTLQGAIKAKAIDINDMFDETTQNKIFDYLVQSRPNARKFLNGDPSVSLDDAVLDIAQEWAAVGVPHDGIKGAHRMLKKGESFYEGDGKNHASISPDSVAEALIRERNQLLSEKQKQIQSAGNVSMSLDQASKENTISNEILNTTPKNSSIINNYNVGVKENPQTPANTVEDDRPIFDRVRKN